MFEYRKRFQHGEYHLDMLGGNTRMLNVGSLIRLVIRRFPGNKS